jgi:membrane associated rhomboid family serine protease
VWYFQAFPVLPLRDINPTRRVPYVTYLFIALNLGVFAYQFLSLSPVENQLFVHRHGVVPLFLLSGYGPSLSTLVSSTFMHGGIAHLGSNMWFLHIFGDNVEDALGHFRYAAFYLCAGVAAAIAHAFMEPGSQLPLVGASGAISGVLGGYLLMFPRARVVTFVPLFFLFELPAFVFILIWFGIQVFSGFGALGSAQNVGVAFFAHVGGFLAGVAWLLLFGRPKQDPHVDLEAQLARRNLRRS